MGIGRSGTVDEKLAEWRHGYEVTRHAVPSELLQAGASRLRVRLRSPDEPSARSLAAALADAGLADVRVFQDPFLPDDHPDAGWNVGRWCVSAGTAAEVERTWAGEAPHLRLALALADRHGARLYGYSH